MIIRVQSSEGTRRIECQAFDTVEAFYQKVKKEFKINDAPGASWFLSKSHDDKGRVAVSKSGTMGGFANGELFFLVNKLTSNAGGEPFGGTPQSSRPGTSMMDVDMDMVTKPKNASRVSSASTSADTSENISSVDEDDVDKWLWQQDGRIMRPRDPRVCRHQANSRCLHCAPLDPFDEEYLKSCDPPIKFLSFHSYLRKLKSGADKGKFVSLENTSYRIKPGCTTHAPWPEGICTKCQPSAVTLAAQRYRHVDYVQFENGDMVDRFLDFWRRSGAQRIGILIGRYEAHETVPLGIRAKVTCIYEPPQNCSEAAVELLPDPQEAQVDALLNKLGLRRVGWIFTDLVPLSAAERTAQPGAIVRHHRGTADTFFLSAPECIIAAHLQNRVPNPCKLAKGGQFGSKFVTVVVTGDSKGQIGFEAYQVSAQGAALVRDGCLVPTKDAPELAFVRESSAAQYVPDVFFAERDRYGNEVQRIARPLPVAYLLTDMPVGFPLEPTYSLVMKPSAKTSGQSRRPFEAENRAQVGDSQSLATFATYLDQFLRASDASLFEAVADWHVLYFFATDDFLALRGGLDLLLSAVRTSDRAKADSWFARDEWGTVLQLVASTTQAPSPQPTPRSAAPQLNPGAQLRSDASSTMNDRTSSSGADREPQPAAGWPCAHCTFINPPGRVECDICGLPLNA